VKITYDQGDTYEGEFANEYRNGFGKNNNRKLNCVGETYFIGNRKLFDKITNKVLVWFFFNRHFIT